MARQAGVALAAENVEQLFFLFFGWKQELFTLDDLDVAGSTDK